MKRALALAGIAVLAILAWLFAALWPEPPETPARAPSPPLSLEQLERGRYLARVADCMPCHTRRGGPAFAGGREIATPFGTFYSPNLTPDPEHGLGRWTADDFWRALHDGRSRDGRPLYPVFPYTNYTRMTRADSDALFDYLRSVPAQADENRAHELRFPYRHRVLLWGWRALFFRPGEFEPDPARSASWNRGAYLVQGPGHCSACHEARNALGAVRSRDNPAGGLVLRWYAPSLYSSREAGVAGWPLEEITRLLRTGVSAHASTLGPMAEVVYESLQYLTDADAAAMAEYLASLPDREPPAASGIVRPAADRVPALMARGAELYAEHCADCHGDAGQGRPPAAPALAGNRAVVLGPVANPVRIVLFGGYPPGTAGNPRPFGMPPYLQTLDDADVAAVLTYIRGSWGNTGEPVSAVEAARHRGQPLW